jgi:integrase
MRDRRSSNLNGSVDTRSLPTFVAALSRPSFAAPAGRRIRLRLGQDRPDCTGLTTPAGAILSAPPSRFTSTATWRDPDNFRARWRKVREDLGVPDVTSHSFRKSLATLIDDEGLSARITADHLGHARVSETMDTYMARGRVHTKVADLLDRRINDE